LCWENNLVLIRRGQITGYLSASLVFTALAINVSVYESLGAKQAAAAGFILLAIIDVRLPYWLKG
jgi:heme/copper-type cytochrome/quinol oxidase subunit 4